MDGVSDQNVDGCHHCVCAEIGFDCAWCPAAKRCSSGFDRLTQPWTKYGCDVSIWTRL